MKINVTRILKLSNGRVIKETIAKGLDTNNILDLYELIHLSQIEKEITINEVEE